MLIQLIGLIALVVVAVTLAVWARAERARPAAVLHRMRGTAPVAPNALLLGPTASGGRWSRFANWVGGIVPAPLLSTERQEELAQAGFLSPGAPALYAAVQTVLALLLATLLGILVRDRTPAVIVVSVVIGAVMGLAIPPAVVGRIREDRQRKMRNGLPDMLDLLLVCVEAGISLDAAILRVGRELVLIHPDLSEELLTLGRKQNAGIPREEALRGMYNRTGLLELRAISANIIQSERWGTSMARVLRVDSEVMRRKRREYAERRAALASTKMIFPLALLILPALFVVIGGPAILQIREIFNALSGQ